MLYKKGTKEHLMNYYAVNKKEILIYFGLFFLIITGIAESELPRTMMLSTDRIQYIFENKLNDLVLYPIISFIGALKVLIIQVGTGVLDIYGQH